MTAIPPLSAGDLRTIITIQSPVFTDDGAGGRTAAWGGDVVCHAEVAPISGGETFRAGLDRRTQFYRIRIRFRDGVSPSNRVLLNGLALNIRTCADPDGRRCQLELLVESGVADG